MKRIEQPIKKHWKTNENNEKQWKPLKINETYRKHKNIIEKHKKSYKNKKRKKHRVVRIGETMQPRLVRAEAVYGRAGGS